MLRACLDSALYYEKIHSAESGELLEARFAVEEVYVPVELAY